MSFLTQASRAARAPTPPSAEELADRAAAVVERWERRLHNDIRAARPALHALPTLLRKEALAALRDQLAVLVAEMRRVESELTDIRALARVAEQRAMAAIR